MKKTLAAILAAAMLTLSLAGCNSKPAAPAPAPAPAPAAPSASADVQAPAADGVKSDKKFTLKVVCSGPKDDGIDIATEIYKRSYPNATIETITAPWGPGGTEMREKELIMIQSGDVPDIGKMVWGKEFAREGLLADITEDVKKMSIYPNLSAGQLDRMTYDGKTFGMTFGNNSIYMFYNKDILKAAGWENPPKTIEEVSKLAADIKAKELKTADGKPVYLTTFEGGNWATDYWLWAGGGTQMTPDFSKTMIDSPESIKAYQYMQDMVKGGSVPKIDGTVSQLWLNNQAALLFSGEWEIPGSNDAKVNYGVAATPVGPTGKNTVSIGGVEWAVFEGAKNRQEAIDFIEIFVSDEFAYTFGRGVTDLSFYDDPKRQELWKQDGLFDAKMVQKEQLASTQYNFLEAPFVYAEASKIYADALEKILVRLDPVDVTMKAAAQQINAGIAAEMAK